MTTFSVVLRFTWYLNRKYFNMINIHYILGVLKDLKIFQYTKEIMDTNHLNTPSMVIFKNMLIALLILKKWFCWNKLRPQLKMAFKINRICTWWIKSKWSTQDLLCLVVYSNWALFWLKIYIKGVLFSDVIVWRTPYSAFKTKSCPTGLI